MSGVELGCMIEFNFIAHYVAVTLLTVLCIKTILEYNKDSIMFVSLTNQITRKLQIFVNKCLRRVMNIEWTDKIKKEEMWRISEQKAIENQIK